jgi:hypothetical protein
MYQANFNYHVANAVACGPVSGPGRAALQPPYGGCSLISTPTLQRLDHPNIFFDGDTLVNRAESISYSGAAAALFHFIHSLVSKISFLTYFHQMRKIPVLFRDVGRSCVAHAALLFRALRLPLLDLSPSWMSFPTLERCHSWAEKAALIF